MAVKYLMGKKVIESNIIQWKEILIVLLSITSHQITSHSTKHYQRISGAPWRKSAWKGHKGLLQLIWCSHNSLTCFGPILQKVQKSQNLGIPASSWFVTYIGISSTFNVFSETEVVSLIKVNGKQVIDCETIKVNCCNIPTRWSKLDALCCSYF